MSDFASLKDFFGSPEFREKIKMGAVAKKDERGKYTPDLWGKAKDSMDSQTFPERFFVSSARPKQDNGYTLHKVEGQSHSLISYLQNVSHNWVFDTEWRFAYCPTCNKAIHKTGTVINKVENKSYTRWFVKNGKDEQEQRGVAPAKVEKREQVQLAPESVFDGKIPESLEEILKGGE